MTLSDELQLSGKPLVTQRTQDKIKKFIQNIKRDMDLTIENVEVINKHAGKLLV